VLTLYMIRHGQTEYSRENRFCGSIDPPLTSEGSAMAEAFAEAYGALGWQAIYTSTRRRAIATAAPTAKRANVEIEQEPGLGEIAYGDWEGESQDEIAKRYPEAFEWWAADPASRGTPGGETAFQVAARAVPVIERIREKHKDGNVLVVSHKATLRILTCALLHMDVRLYRDRIGQPVAALTVFEFKKRGALLKMLGDRSHLPPHLRELEGT
jgi:broad specificity phosphatase PhoE